MIRHATAENSWSGMGAQARRTMGCAGLHCTAQQLAAVATARTPRMHGRLPAALPTRPTAVAKQASKHMHAWCALPAAGMQGCAALRTPARLLTTARKLSCLPPFTTLVTRRICSTWGGHVGCWLARCLAG